MADADGFVRAESLVLGMFDESELDHLFEEEMEYIRRKVICCRYVLFYFIRLLWFYRFLAEYFKSFLFWININFQ